MPRNAMLRIFCDWLHVVKIALDKQVVGYRFKFGKAHSLNGVLYLLYELIALVFLCVC